MHGGLNVAPNDGLADALDVDLATGRAPPRRQAPRHSVIRTAGDVGRVRIRLLPEALQIEQYLPDDTIILKCRLQCQFGARAQADQDELVVAPVLQSVERGRDIDDGISHVITRATRWGVAVANAAYIKAQ